MNFDITGDIIVYLPFCSYSAMKKFERHPKKRRHEMRKIAAQTAKASAVLRTYCRDNSQSIEAILLPVCISTSYYTSI